MDIEKMLRGQFSAVDVLREQADRHRALVEQVGAAGATQLPIEAMQNGGHLAAMDQLRLSARQLASAGLPRSYIDALSLGGASEQVYRQAMATTYTPPDFQSSLAALFGPPQTTGLAEALARLATPVPAASGLSEALARLLAPPSSYYGISEALTRLTGPQRELVGVADRLAELFNTSPLSGAGRESVRASLGDWRDPIAFRPNIELPATRLALYVDQGMSDDIVGVDPEDLHEYVESALLDMDDEGNVAAYRLLMHLEQALRQLIRIALEDAFGPKWWLQRVPVDVRDKCDAKLQEAVAAGAENTHPIDYADFTDYQKIICRGDNFKQAFKPIFGRVEDVRESLQRLHPVRLICMHSRIIRGADLVLVQFEAPRILARVKPHLKQTT
jgi:hypothetical protein